jgi:hypothetical protein
MEDFTNEIKRKAQRIGYEMKGLAQEMSNEMRGVREIIREKAGKLSDDIKKKLIR